VCVMCERESVCAWVSVCLSVCVRVGGCVGECVGMCEYVLVLRVVGMVQVVTHQWLCVCGV